MAAPEAASEAKKRARKHAFKAYYPDHEDPENENPGFFSLDTAALRAVCFDGLFVEYVNAVKRHEAAEAQARMEQDAAEVRVRQAQMELKLQVEWNESATFFGDKLNERVAKEKEPGFAEAVDAMKGKLSGAFPFRSECILFCLPTKFILTGGKSSTAEMVASMKNMLKANSQLFHEFRGIDDFLVSFTKALPSVVTHIEKRATTSTGITYAPQTNLITIETTEPSEFHPSSTLLMRDS